MVIRKLLTVLIAFTIISCTAATQPVKDETAAKPAAVKGPSAVKLPPPPPPVIKPEIRKEDPLENVKVTINAVQGSLSSILYMIASDAGLNLVISPEIDVKRKFTINVTDMPARDALDMIADNAGVSYSISGTSLKVAGYVTKTFKFPYVRMNTDQKSEIGGDVFGSTGTSLSGDYTLKYENPKQINDVQSQIIYGLKAILFPETETGQGARKIRTTSKSSTGTSGNSSSSEDYLENSGYFQGSEGYLFNRFTGILKVTTTPSKMKVVANYMHDVVTELDKQVLIEAKMVEVVLNNSSAYGINWQSMIDGNPGTLSLGTTGGTTSLIDGLTPVGIITNGSLNKWFAFMASHGRVESVGNPRIRVMNGQAAMISSGQLIPYWEMNSETDADTNQTSVNYKRVTVLDGVVLGVTAHVKENGTITLNIVPVFSDVESVKTQYNQAGEVVASYPVVNLKEAGTVLNVKSGNTIIMGGLITNVETEKEEKVPVLGDIPLLGYLFKGKSKVTEKRELVIFLKTTIING